MENMTTRGLEKQFYRFANACSNEESEEFQALLAEVVDAFQNKEFDPELFQNFYERAISLPNCPKPEGGYPKIQLNKTGSALETFYQLTEFYKELQKLGLPKFEEEEDEEEEDATECDLPEDDEDNKLKSVFIDKITEINQDIKDIKTQIANMKADIDELKEQIMKVINVTIHA